MIQLYHTKRADLLEIAVKEYGEKFGFTQNAKNALSVPKPDFAFGAAISWLASLIKQ
jgi:hypothetical protein